MRETIVLLVALVWAPIEAQSQIRPTRPRWNRSWCMKQGIHNPINGCFFEQLEAKGGREGALTRFRSDYPNPGDRVVGVENEMRQLPPRQFTTGSNSSTASGRSSGGFEHDRHSAYCWLFDSLFHRLNRAAES
jgi:hypothetical protein